MTTEPFAHKAADGADIYFREFDETGQIFDFSGKTFKSLAIATTLCVGATEGTDVNSSVKSVYAVSVELANLNEVSAASRINEAHSSPSPTARSGGCVTRST